MLSTWTQVFQIRRMLYGKSSFLGYSPVNFPSQAEILVSNSVHYIPLTCAVSTSPGYGIVRKKSCCISKGQLCDDSASCCGRLECSHSTNLMGQKLLDQPKVCREPIKEPCKDIGDPCSSHTQCCEVTTSFLLFDFRLFYLGFHSDEVICAKSQASL